MKKILLATHNRHKVREMAQILASGGLEGYEVFSLDEVGITEDVEETGTTFEENALIKARAAAHPDYIVAADDSGLEVDALEGAPGVYSARYCGDHASDEENNEKLLRELGDTPMEKRTARYVCAIAAIFPNGEEWVSRSTCEGYIGFELNGTEGFGYDPMFYPLGYRVTFGQVPAEEKHTISHRGKAVRALVEWLKEKEK